MEINKFKREKTSILNIGSGKLRNVKEIKNYINDDYFIIHLDYNYLNGYTSSYAENEHKIWLENNSNSKKEINVKCDIFEFLEKYIITFNVITFFRFFEHICRDKLLYFIYLLSTITEKDAVIDLVCPDFQILAKMILEEKPLKNPDFDKNDIIISTELFNEPDDPHLNITTPDRIIRLFEYEGRFKNEYTISPYFFDGRKIYFRSIIKRK